MGREHYIYIMTNIGNSVFYIGMTNDLLRRVSEHRGKLVEGFTEKYNLDKLVYLESTSDVKLAIAREKQLKNWHRQWKINLIKENNPEFTDLYEEILK